MSYSAVDWAMAQALTPSARKFLLVALAHHTNSQSRTCHPSIARLAETTALDRKTVIAHLNALEAAGYIADTGQRHGTTKQVKEYRMSMSNQAEQSPGERSQKRNSTENGTVPFFLSNSTVFPSKESQKRDTEQGFEQVSEQGKPPGSSKAAGPSSFEKQTSKSRPKELVTLQTFLDTCKQQGIKPILESDPIFGYAEKVGISEEMLATAWGEFKARYLTADKRQKDWPAHYRNAVKRNWYNLWFLKDGEDARWTTAGEQARRAAA